MSSAAIPGWPSRPAPFQASTAAGTARPRRAMARRRRASVSFIRAAARAIGAPSAARNAAQPTRRGWASIAAANAIKDPARIGQTLPRGRLGNR